MMEETNGTFLNLLHERRFVQSKTASLTPLTGGVSSEIYLVEDGDQRFVVKRALEKLNVKDDWFADTSRNHSEQAYIRYVSSFRPDAMPQIFRSDAEAGLFSMEFLDGFQNWKHDLLLGRCDVELAKQAGSLLGEIHRHSWGDTQVRSEFDSLANFDQLRIDPYLRATAAKNPTLRDQILSEADRLTKSRQCLIHGDYSPKNVLYRDGRFVPLDCEVACFADAAFDLSFFLNHLFLKSLYHASRRLPWDEMITAAHTGYRDANSEHADDVVARTVKLLPMLMLARVDGKSPVGYLDPAKQNFVRRFVTEQLAAKSMDIHQLQTHWFETLYEQIDDEN